jgi:hypothetical protein
VEDCAALHVLGSYVQGTPSESLNVPPLAASWLEMENVTFKCAPAVHVWHVAGVVTLSDQTPDGHEPPPPLLPRPLLVLEPPGEGHDRLSVAHDTPSEQHVE